MANVTLIAYDPANQIARPVASADTPVDGSGLAVQTGAGGATFSATAGEAIASARLPLYVANASGKVLKITNNEDQVAGLIGLSAGSAAGDGSALSIYGPGQVISGFAGLTVGAEYWAWNGQIVLFSAVTSGHWCRPAGVAKSATELLFQPGPVIKKP
ncbi:MAG TPA: hypothetical protein VEJ18_02095 [Planctomycetota bacterium]|nr:hypothetical protein [Planctomycetota bacterium]